MLAARSFGDDSEYNNKDRGCNLAWIWADCMWPEGAICCSTWRTLVKSCSSRCAEQDHASAGRTKQMLTKIIFSHIFSKGKIFWVATMSDDDNSSWLILIKIHDDYFDFYWCDFHDGHDQWEDEVSHDQAQHLLYELEALQYNESMTNEKIKLIEDSDHKSIETLFDGKMIWFGRKDKRWIILAG